MKHFQSIRVTGRGPLFAGLGLTAIAFFLGGAALASGNHPATDRHLSRTAEELSAAFENVATEIQPSLVSIHAVKRIDPASRGGMQVLPFGSDPFEQFFGGRLPRRFQIPGQPSQPYFQEGQGSGFVVSEDGYIVTNNHVVEGADKLEVRFSNKRVLEAEVVGTDPQTDLAILRVDAKGLTPVRLGDSDDLRVGAWVVAAGNPFGLASSITAGIVSATGRSQVGIADYEDFIQTDAAINPGNSGGPLLNLDGEVVGVNSAIYSKSGGYMGIGFAIPINIVKSVKGGLIEHGSVDRGFLGVLIQNMDEGLARSFGYDSTEGVLISQVNEDSPAAEAGLEAGDIILSYDGKEVSDTNHFRLRVAATPPGSEVPMRVLRNGEEVELTVRVGELESKAADSGGAPGLGKDLGLQLQTLTPELLARLGDIDADKGVLVTEVSPVGRGARAGLRPGDVILEVQGKEIANLGEFKRALREHEGDGGVRLTVIGRGGRHFVYLSLK